MKTHYSGSLAAARKRLGLTQEQMAIKLGVSKSMVKLVETNRRTLNSDKLVKLASLEILLASVEQSRKIQLPAFLKQQHDSSESSLEMELRFRSSQCIHQASQLELRLAKMQHEYELIITSLSTIEAIASKGLAEDEPFARTVLSAKTTLMKKLARCNPKLQAQTKARIALLRAEAALNTSIQPRYVHTNEKPITSLSKQNNMDYSVSLISSRADCQALIDMAVKDKDSLAYRRMGLERQKLNASETSVNIDADLAAITAEIAALQTVVDGLPDGETKDDTQVRLTKAIYKKFLLEERKANYGSLALIGKEYDIACLQRSIDETDAYITALTTRMNELPTS